ncbi:MAG: outer membrane protein assembly factor BamA [Paracoccaceae bacterium]
MTGGSGHFLGIKSHFVAFFLAASTLISPTAATLILTSQQAQAQASFSRIDVVGNQRIEADSIRSFAGIAAGQPLTPEELNAAVRRLFATGLFETAEIRRSGDALVIEVKENPTINRINFEGNRAIDDETLLSAIQLRPRRAYNRSAAEADAQAVIDAYAASGRYNAEVTPVIIKLPDNRVDLAFEIFEGRATEVQRISFVGNRKFSNFRLRRVIETGEAGLFSFLFTNDTYDPDRVEFDKQLLREYYLQRGYIDFQVRSATAELARERSGFFVTFSIFEGEQYRYGKIEVEVQAEQLDDAEFKKIAARLRPGDVYNVKHVEKVIKALSFEAGRQGFAFIDVRPLIKKNQGARTADIIFQFVEARRIFVERIDIRGNTQTLDRVIRRQFELVEGDPFNAQKLADAEDKIRALGFFADVSIRVEEGSKPNLAVIDVEVEDAPTGSLGFGIGYSTTEGTSATITLSERNFLGRGQFISLSYETSSDFDTYTLSFTEPALFDQDLAAGFDIYRRNIDQTESSFSMEQLGFQPRLEFPISENGRLSPRYRISSDEVTNVDVDASPLIKADKGAVTTSSLGFRYAYDRRNSRVDPTSGYILVFDQDVAGLGGDAQYSKTVARARAYTSFFDEDVVLRGEVEGGYLAAFNGPSRVTDRFFLGGNNFLGFQPAGIGPRDKCTACGGGGGNVNDALGGNIYAVVRVQASFPIGLPESLGVHGGVFANVGSLWSLDKTAGGASGVIDDSAKLRAAAGFSIFWTTPIGPLRLNFSRPIEKVPGDAVENFRISIDTRF